MIVELTSSPRERHEDVFESHSSCIVERVHFYSDENLVGPQQGDIHFNVRQRARIKVRTGNALLCRSDGVAVPELQDLRGWQQLSYAKIRSASEMAELA